MNIMKQTLILSLIILLSFCAKSQEQYEVSIVGGRIALEEEFPWMAELISDNEHLCGASLINEYWVISAGHCGIGDPTSGINPPDKVIINSIYRNNTSIYSEEIEIDTIIPFPGYSLTSLHIDDISLIRLKTPSTINPISINSVDTSLIIIGDTVLTMGWGITNPSGNYTNELRIAQPLLKQINPKILLAGFDAGENEEGAAAGDSGGPLFVDNNGELSLIGLVSGGSGPTTTEGNPGKFTRLFAYKNWIQSIMNSYEPVGIIENKNEFDIYQNENGSLFIKQSSPILSQTELKIYNSTGKYLVNLTVNLSNNYQQIKLPKFTKGLYFIRSKEHIVCKIIIN